jgi:hypothetical protein
MTLLTVGGANCSVWLSRRAIGYLRADQVDYFKFTPLYEGFKMLHDMASETQRPCQSNTGKHWIKVWVEPGGAQGQSSDN